jgi:hypothetical protein
MKSRRNNMKTEIDINKIVKDIDLNKLVTERAISDIVANIDFEKIVDELLEDEEMRNNLNKKVIVIINEYLSSEEGKEFIIETFKDVIANSDILTDEKIIELIAELLKKSLKI